MLLTADDVVITASPDLASLRNAKNMVDLIRQSRPNDAPPRVVLNRVGVPAGPVYSVPEVFEDEQVKHLAVTATLHTPENGDKHYITQPVTLNRTPAQVVAPAPEWGEHTDEVLQEAGYSQEDIKTFHHNQCV